MERTLLFFVLMLPVCLPARAGRIGGMVRDAKGNPLAYASVFVKGTTLGTTANREGHYFLDLAPGKYTIVAQYVGYERQEKQVETGQGPLVLDFTLSLQSLSLAEVVVTPGGEDPAYEIIRQTIKKREAHRQPLDSFTCEAYIRTLIKTRKLPKKIFGQPIEEDDRQSRGLDSAGKGILYLSESLTKIAFKKPGRVKLEVLSGRESGSNGFGFNFPTFINFYDNNVNVLAPQLNPRGFVSPVADAALNYYRYHYEGSFVEDGREIDRIKVIPRRKYEPLFSGTINIVDGEWRIHSLDLLLTKASELEIFDSLRIKQIRVPVTPDIWQTKDQVVYFTFKLLGIDAVGNFLNVYNKYDVTPAFAKKYFNRVVVKYDTAVNKKTKAYWDSIRPVQLSPEEIGDYALKDSLRARRDSLSGGQTRDSLLKHQGPITVKQLLWKGFNRSDFDPKHPVHYSWDALLKQVQYNTVEGLVLNAGGSIRKRLRREDISLSPHLRYGFSNTHLNAWASLRLSRRRFSPESDEDPPPGGRYAWTLAGGKRVSQFNKDNPISPLMNGLYTLLDRRNYMKIYENWFADMTYHRWLDNGLQLSAGLLYEDRLPIDNTTDFSVFKNADKVFTPNFPFEKIPQQFARHQAAIATVDLQFKPGERYIQFPHSKMPIGSRYPTLAASYTKGIHDILGSDVDFDKWSFSIWDDANFKLRGDLYYRLDIGGFLNRRSVYIQDYRHFNGNQLIFASQYRNSFQLAPYYANSTTASFYATGHLEHHFNGFLTNKIPLFRRLNWHLVAGSNAFYVNRQNNYVEIFGGLENIFKLFRVDLVASYLNGREGQVGIRIGLGGLIGSHIHPDL